MWQPRSARSRRVSRPGMPSWREARPIPSRPKGVRRQPSSPEMQAASAKEVARYWGLLADSSIVVLMNGPMYHSAPAAYGMGSARLGLNVVLQPRFEAADMLRLIEKHRD